MPASTEIESTTETRNGWLALGDELPGVDVKWEAGVPVRVSINENVVFADDCEQELRAALEALCGRWFVVGEWQATNEENFSEVVALLAVAEEQPTHRVTFTPIPLGGPAGKPKVDLVMLCSDGDDGTGPAYTHDEWDAEGAAAWECREDGWHFQGQTTPGGANGEVEIVALPAE